jgi:hypothetical protein
MLLAVLVEAERCNYRATIKEWKRHWWRKNVGGPLKFSATIDRVLMFLFEKSLLLNNAHNALL